MRVIASRGAALLILAAAVPQTAWAAEAAAALRDACRADYKTLCSDVQPGGGRILACFQTHRDRVSPGCLQALEQAKAERARSGVK